MNKILYDKNGIPAFYYNTNTGVKLNGIFGLFDSITPTGVLNWLKEKGYYDSIRIDKKTSQI